MPAAVLALVGVILGIAPGIADALATASLEGYGANAPEVHLSLWHGLGLPLALSFLTLAGGAVLWGARQRVEPVLAWGGAVPSGGEVYLATLRRLGASSARVTGFVQNGSLPVYAGVIMATAAALPAGALLAGWDWWGWPPLGP